MTLLHRFQEFMFVCVLCPFNSEVNLLSLAKCVKLGKYTIPTGNRTPGRRVAVHYATAAPRKLQFMFLLLAIMITFSFNYINHDLFIFSWLSVAKTYFI